MYKYKIFGLNITSEIKMNCYEADFEDVEVEIVYSKEFVSESYEDGLIRLSSNIFWFHIIDVGIFSVENGNKIIITPYKNADEKSIELYILGSGFGALLIQKNEFPIHGAFVEYNSVGVAIVGDAGAGKTSLTSALTKNSAKIITDDVMRLSFLDNKPFVYPSYPSQKMWSKTANALNIDTSNLKSIVNRTGKYFVEDWSIFSNKPMEIKYMFEIVECDVDEVCIESLDKKASLELLIRNSYRYFIIELSGRLKDHFGYVMQLERCIQTYIIKRPKNKFTVDDQIKLIDKVIGDQNEKVS
ncbi:MAG: hypothetical protein JEZ08_17895 [Clostridiales bacterium]|nr:hypothetical protein [Clostridiales bacterium]